MLLVGIVLPIPVPPSAVVKHRRFDAVPPVAHSSRSSFRESNLGPPALQVKGGRKGRVKRFAHLALDVLHIQPKELGNLTRPV